MPRLYSRLLLITLMLLAILIPSFRAEANDANADNVAQGLQNFLPTLDDLGDIEALNDAIPFTDLDPSEALDLDNLFTDALNDALSGPFSTLDELETAIENADTTVGGVAITFSNVVVDTNPSDGTLIDVNIDVQATRTLDTSLSTGISETNTTLNGTDISLTLTLATTLAFQLDTILQDNDPALAFYTTADPLVTISVDSSGSLDPFVTQLGLADVTVVGTGLINIDAQIGFQDPDGNGRITQDEWQSTAIADLFVAQFVDAPGDDIYFDLSLTASNLGGLPFPATPGATVVWQVANINNGIGAPTITWNNGLDGFSSLTEDDLLTGLAQAVTGLIASQAIGDMPIPFTDATLSDALTFAQPLIDYIQNLGLADIACGTSPGNGESPPTGDTSNVKIGDTVYCRAYTVEDPTTVTWVLNPAGPITNGSSLNTAGTSPTQDISFVATADGKPDIQVNLDLPSFSPHSIVPRFETAQELFDQLQDLGGFSELTPADVDFDPDTYALTYHLHKSLDPVSESVNTDFGDQLKKDTGLVGLTPGSGASAEFTATDIELDITFGVILDPSVPNVADRFFIQVRDDAPELQANVSADVTIDLQGQIGFVDVAVVGDAAQNPDSSEAFDLGPAEPADPMFALDINVTDYAVDGTAIVINDAIGVPDFLADVASHITADCNVALSAGLMATAEVSGVASASGGVHVAWTDAFNDNTCNLNTNTLNASVTSDFENQLQVLDLNPGLFGSHTDATPSANTLTDSSGVDFTAVDRGLIGVRLANTTDGSSCIITGITSSTLTCESGLQGGTDNQWQQNDKYEVASNPFAMLNIILDNIEAIVTAIDNSTGSNIGGILDQELPLLPVSPNDLITQFRDIQNALDEIRTSGSDAIITCGPINVDVINGAFDVDGDGDIDGDDDGTVNGVTITDGLAQSNTLAGVSIIGGKADLNGDGTANDNASAPAGDPFAVPAGSKLYCHATTNSTVSGVEWTIAGGTSTVDNNATNTNTISDDPTELAEFTVNFDPNNDSFNYRVRLSFSDAGGFHGVSLPSLNPPTSLAALEGVIEEKLGIPEDALTFELTDLPPAGGGAPDGVFDLVMRLGYGVCTKDNAVLDNCNASGNVLVPRLEIPVSIDLEDAGIPSGLVGFQNEAALSLEFLAQAQLDMGISLDTNLDVVVLDTTEINVEAAAAGDDISFKANIGPLSLLAGETAVFNGSHTSSNSSTTVLTDTNGIDFLTLGITTADTIVNTTDDASCTVTDVTATTVTCSGGLSDGAAWDENDSYQIGGNGEAKIGIGFNVASTVGTETSDISTFISNLDANFVPKAVSGSCTGDACAALSLAFAIDDTPEIYLGDLTLEAVLLSGDFDITIAGYERIGDRINAATLDWLLLFKALPELLGEVEEGLQGAANDIEIPLVGDALDAGADVAGTLKDVAEVIEDGVDLLADNIGETPADVETNLEAYIADTLDGIPDIEYSDIDVIVTCDTDPCDNTPIVSLASIKDVRIQFLLGQTLVEAAPSFDLGIPGVPLRSAGTLDAGVEWSLLVDFGLSKDHGPYLVAHDENSTNHKSDDPELELIAQVGLGAAEPDVQASCNDNDPLDAIPDGTDLGTGNFSADHCILGELAFLQVHLRDSETDPTRLALEAGLNVIKDVPDDLAIIGFRDLINASVGIEFSAAVEANVNLRFRTGLNGVDGFPTVLGTFELDWGRSFTAGTLGGSETTSIPLEVGFDNLFLDAGSFVSQFLAPVATSVQDITSPLMPVIETVSSPLPVLSDISRMTGGGDISLLTLMEAVSGSDLTMLRRLLEFIKFANQVASLSNSEAIWIGLGSGGLLSPGGFSLKPDAVLEGVPTSGKQRDLIDFEAPDFTVKSSTDLQSGISTESNIPEGTFGVGGLTFPFIQEPTQIFGLLMGEDATLVRYDAGTMKATATVDFTFRFAVGPIPMSVTLLGTASLEGRFAMGYDTYGIRQVVNGDSPVELLNGLFIDDLDADGRDVPEITLKGTVAARAAIDLVIVSAGVEGGIELTVALDLDDRPDPDGKLRLDEIINKLSNPICLFVVSGQLDAFFAAFVKIDFFLFSKTFRFELARVTLLNFEFACDPPNPELAHISGGELTLLMGSQSLREDRGIAVDEIDEEFTVRMLEDGRVSVTAFGEYQTFCCNFTRIIANADDGNDIVSIEAGATAPDAEGNVTPIPFNVPVTLNGGEGNDELRGGDAGDIINGGPGNDKLTGGGGIDTIHGNGDSDAIDGGLGDDLLYGDDGDDRINGGPGADRVEGGADDDQLNGGPGTNEGKSSDDLGDILVGNGGFDALSGGFGNDLLYGDSENNDCNENASTPGLNADILDGGLGSDELYGGSGEDELIGGDNGDTLCGNGDDDTLFGDGDDAVTDGPDIISGGNGHDTIYGNGAGDTLNGNNGNDLIYGSTGNDTIYGGDGRDLLYGEADNDTIYGDDGLSAGDAAVGTIDCENVGAGGGNADCLFGAAGDDTLHGEGGHDFMYGDDGNDTMNGNAGDDLMRGGKDNDTMNGNDGLDEMYGDSGADTMHGNAGNDFMRGGIGADTMFGDDAIDTMYGDGDDDTMEGNDGDDIMFGNAGDDYMEGNANVDTMAGGTGQDDMIGGSSSAGLADDGDTMTGDDAHDVMIGDNGTIVRTGVTLATGAEERTVTLFDLADGNSDTAVSGPDQMSGNGGRDQLYGGGESDTIHGNDDDDYIEGNGASDFLYGDADQDDLIGGTSQEGGGTPDTNDVMEGNAGHDVMAGDNASITRDNPLVVDTADGAVVRTVTLYDLSTGNNNTAAAGPDTMDGNDGNDDMYGGGEADTLHGNNGDDYIEGNGDNDAIHGDADQDDLIGGTSQEGGGTPDGSDTITGDADYDVILGDNGSITRDFGTWQINTFNDAVTRDITLFDVETTAVTPVADSSDGDILTGGSEDDVVYGQGNGDDVDDDNDGLVNEDPADGLDNDDDGVVDEDGGGDFIHGNDGDDYLEGNAGADWLYGDADNDDMVGGTGRINDDPATGTDGRHDGDDTLFGGTGYDVMAGDNALIVRTLVGGQWQSNTFNGGVQHEARILLDVDSLFAATSGADTMYGGDQDDLMYGQGDDDVMYGENGDDFMEGNAADDTMDGGADQDDMIGGTVAAGLTDGSDTMVGDSAADVMLGDNGTIDRPLSSGLWQIDANTSDVIRDVVLLDVETTANAPVDASLSGDDTMSGNADNDIMFGQGGSDTMSGGDDFDYMEGNAGPDLLNGDGGEDDMIGGGSANDGVIDADRVGDGLTDADDTLYGGEDGDVMTGDNARLLRDSVWQIDPNTGDVIRDIQLFDVDHISNTIDDRTSGSDTMYGEDGRDFMFGQGNDNSDADNDGVNNEDQIDGVDNDRDGREDASSVGYDCEDGRDNDGDGLIDSDEPTCAAAIDEDPGGDEMHGGNDDDYMEGNHGSDWMFGDAGEDDMLGGNSAGDGHIFGGVVPTDLVDGDDVMHGGLEDDVMIGDNGGINRPTDGSGIWLRLDTFGYDIVVRVTTMDQTPEDGEAAGNDYMTGDAGNDEMYGQLGHDYMEGNADDDAMVGDLGQVTSVIEDGSRQQIINIPAPFLEDTIYAAGTLYRETELFSFLSGDGAEGNDTMLGGDGLDSMHGGAGADIMNGNADEDHLFGGDDNDAVWGGPGHDHVWGGQHDDYLDVVPREERAVQQQGQTVIIPADPPEWFTYAGVDHFQDIDTIYGGWDADGMQADIGGPGPVPGDRLVDWTGGYNVYYVCPAAYGEGVITRQISPAMITYLEQLAQADGAILTDTQGTSGFREVAIVYPPHDIRDNANPTHPDHTGHFTCTGQ